jgi:hypothetical protein
MKGNSAVQKKQKQLIRSLSQVGPVVEGTLSTVRRICGNPGCRCRTNPAQKHPAMFLTWKENQKTQTLYVPVRHVKEAELWSKNYKRLKKQIRKVSDFHKKLLRSK